MNNLHNLYEEDAYLWYTENARLLKEKKFNEIDVDNIVEELESMGRHEQDRIQSVLTILFLHILKLKYQSNYEEGLRSWKLSVVEHRDRALDYLKQNPSLKGHISDISTNAYKYARTKAAKETGLSLDTFPKTMPFTLEQALTIDWMP